MLSLFFWGNLFVEGFSVSGQWQSECDSLPGGLFALRFHTSRNIFTKPAMTHTVSLSSSLNIGAAAAALLLCPGLASAQSAPFTDHLVGDVGGAVYATSSVIRSKDTKAVVLPYAFAD